MKALLTQNADALEHADICIKKARASELKIITETKANNMLRESNENLNKEIFEIKNTLEEKNNIIVFLNEKITFYENKLNQKDNEILEMKKEGEKRDEQINKLFKEIDILTVELDAKNFNHIEEMKNEKKIVERDLDDYDNLRGILSERENKKKLINEKIKQHMKNNKHTRKPLTGKINLISLIK
jgi:chromosome segregation ATPase